MASAVLRDGDEMLIEVIARDAAPLAGSTGGVTVIRDLPDVDRNTSRIGWVPSRAATYAGRARIRSKNWKSDRFDLFHLHYINRYTDVSSHFPKPLVMSVHDAVPHVPRLGKQVEHRLLRHLYSRPEAIVVHHQRVADELCSRFKVSADRIHVVPYPVLTRRETPERPPEGPPMILLFGGLRPNKGLEVLDEAMRYLAGADIRVVVAGRGHGELERLAVEMQERDCRVTAEIGFVPLTRKAELFHQASVIAIPYTSFSSQSAVVHDAYGYGRPVVVSDVGALGDTVRADGTGLVTPPGDPEALALAITTLLQPPAWGRAFDACTTVSQERSPAAFGREMRAVYEAVVP